MPSMQEFCSMIGDALTYARFTNATKIRAIYPYDCDADQQSDAQTLILCEEEDVPQLASLSDQHKLNVLVCGVSNGDTVSGLFHGEGNVAATSLSMRKAGSILLRAINYYARVKQTLDAAISAQGSLHDFLSAAVAVTEGHVNFYVFSSAFTLIDSCAPMENPGELDVQPGNLDGYGKTEQTSLVLDILSGKGLSEHLVIPITDGDTVSAYLLMTCKDASLVPELFKNLMAHRILNYLRQSYVIYSAEQKVLQKLLADMLVMIPKDVAPLYERLKALPYPLQSHMRFLIVSRPSECGPIWPLISRMREILPHTNMTVYDGCIVALVSGENFLFKPKADMERLEAFLQENDARAIFTAPSKFVRGLRTVYIQAKELLPNIALLMDADAKRCVYFEDVFHFYRVHLCSMALRSHLGHDKIIYLVHPVAIQLIRHDMAYNTDFFDFIVRYSLCGGNIQETAREAHMHRNSAYNKLNKIKELFDVNFSDGDLQRNMVFSMNIIRYNQMKPQDLIVLREPSTS